MACSQPHAYSLRSRRQRWKALNAPTNSRLMVTALVRSLGSASLMRSLSLRTRHRQGWCIERQPSKRACRCAASGARRVIPIPTPPANAGLSVYLPETKDPRPMIGGYRATPNKRFPRASVRESRTRRPSQCHRQSPRQLGTQCPNANAPSAVDPMVPVPAPPAALGD
jgi:hypothetical protein